MSDQAKQDPQFGCTVNRRRFKWPKVRLYQLPFYGITYRTVMKIAHRFNWHYAPVRGPLSPDMTSLRRCDWCGFSDVIRKPTYPPILKA